MSDASHPLNNYLWTYRKRAGYTQHEIARLLGCASANQISRYERGSVPNLKVAIGFEILYKAPICELFRGLYEKEREIIEARRIQLDIPNKKDDSTELPKLLPLPGRRSPVILALGPASRHLGIAVLEGSSLIYWTVKELHQNKPSGRLSAIRHHIITKLIEKFHPRVLVFEEPDPAKSRTASVRFESFRERVRSLCATCGVKAYGFAAKQVKDFLAGDQVITKREIALAIASWYPELRARLPKRRKLGYPEDQRQKIFDAVAVGITYLYGTLNNFDRPLLSVLRFH